MKHRLGNSIEQDPDTHSCREQHREPAEGTELRLRIIPSEPDVPVLAEHEVEDEQENDIHCQGEKPACVGGDPIEEGIEHVPKDLIEEYRNNHESDNQGS